MIVKIRPVIIHNYTVIRVCVCVYQRWVENWGYTTYKMKHLRILKGTMLIQHLKPIFLSAHIYFLLKSSQATFLVVIVFIFLEDEQFFQHVFQ